MLLARVLNDTFRWGDLEIIDARGKRHRFTGEPGLKSTVRLHDTRLHRRLVMAPDLAFGEAYMDGTLTVEEGDLSDFLGIAVANMHALDRHWSQRLTVFLGRAFKVLAQANTKRQSRRNAARHYDLSARLYDLFLDRDRQYSCAYFLDPRDTLEQAQENKKRHIARKLLLEPGMRVLDIGSGWGGLALSLARQADVDVTGLTLSEEQHRLSNERARKAGLADRVRFLLKDYREVSGRFDRIVSVGMFEHVGVPRYGDYFRKCRELLARDGVALLHTIGRSSGPGATAAWIRKHIFPGGYSPALSEVAPVIEKSGLKLTDIEILRLHYAETLKEWRRRFLANRDEISSLYDERFCRMWDFYLAGSEAVFRYGDHVVFQIQMVREHGAAPLTRNYIYEWERTGNQDQRSAAA